MQTLRQFLTEKTFNLSYEVNYLYKALGFEDYVKKIKEGKYNTQTPKKRIRGDDFMKIVKSNDIKEADSFILFMKSAQIATQAQRTTLWTAAAQSLQYQ